MKKSIITGTAGHIDHGKTALVKALTGVDTDRLPEEKARGITIDLGFAHAEWGDTDVSFIDVPGHERFIRNMLAGIGGIDLLMLVIAADESVMPQTREHFDICKLLQIPKGLIVLTKKDLVDEEALSIVREETADLVRGSFLENAAVFEVSSRTGEGIDSLREGILAQLLQVEQRRFTGPFRLPVDRVFVLKGHGTVVTGTLISGSIRKEGFADLLPSGRRVRIRSIHAHQQKSEEAHAGQRTALNLQGVNKEDVNRGDVLVEPDIFLPTSLLDTKISLLQNSNPLVHNALVRFHHLTQDVLARVTLIGRETLHPGESAYAQLRLQSPIHAFYGDRFILRKHSPLVTIGGGVILDHKPLRRVSSGDLHSRDRLTLLETTSTGQRLIEAVRAKGVSGADDRYLKAKLGMQSEEIVRIASEGILFLRNNPVLAVTNEAEETLTRKARDVVKAYHQKFPLQYGVPKEELRSRMPKNIPQELFAAVLDQAVSRKILQMEKDLVSEHGRKISLDAQDEVLILKIEEQIRNSGLGTEGVHDLAQQVKQTPERTRNILYLLVRQQKVVKIAEDYFLHKTAWDELKQRIREMKASRKTFSVPDFKTIFGISRKFAIPLLEQLDRDGITRRSGNERIII